MALTKDFKVYGWGQAEHGAIGMRLSNAKVPNLINVFNERAQQKVKFATDDPSLSQPLKIKDVSCGAQHSAFLTGKKFQILNIF